MENKMSTLEEDLEEEQMNSEAAIDKARKAEQQVDSMTTEISQLQGNVQKAESAKSQLEKQVSKSGAHYRQCVCVLIMYMYVYMSMCIFFQLS